MVGDSGSVLPFSLTPKQRELLRCLNFSTSLTGYGSLPNEVWVCGRVFCVYLPLSSTGYIRCGRRHPHF